MHDVARFYLFVFAALTFAGGAAGYVRARSSASLIAGAVFGLALAAAGYFAANGRNLGLWIGLGLAALLTGRFSSALRKNGKVFPGGIMTLLGLVGMGLCIAGALT